MSIDSHLPDEQSAPVDVYKKGSADNLHSGRSETIRSRLESGQSPIHNFDGDRMRQWRLSAICMSADCREGSKMNGEIIDLAYYYCHIVPMVSQKTGDTIDAWRCVLIDKNGTAWRFVSTTVIDAIDNLRSIFGDGPYVEPVKFTLQRGTARSGNQVYSLVPIDA